MTEGYEQVIIIGALLLLTVAGVMFMGLMYFGYF